MIENDCSFFFFFCCSLLRGNVPHMRQCAECVSDGDRKKKLHQFHWLIQKSWTRQKTRKNNAQMNIWNDTIRWYVCHGSMVHGTLLLTLNVAFWFYSGILHILCWCAKPSNNSHNNNNISHTSTTEIPNKKLARTPVDPGIHSDWEYAYNELEETKIEENKKNMRNRAYTE